MDLNKMNFSLLTKEFGLEENVVDFIGHSIANYSNEDFLSLPASKVIKKIKIYLNSVNY